MKLFLKNLIFVDLIIHASDLENFSAIFSFE